MNWHKDNQEGKLQVKSFLPIMLEPVSPSIFMPSTAKEAYWTQRMIYAPHASFNCKEVFMRELPSPDHAVDYYLVRDLCFEYGADSVGFMLDTLYVKVHLWYNQVSVVLPEGGNVTASFHMWYDVLSQKNRQVSHLPQILLNTLQEFGNSLNADKLPLKNALYRDHCRIQSAGKPHGSIPRWMPRSEFKRSLHLFCAKK